MRNMSKRTQANFGDLRVQYNAAHSAFEKHVRLPSAAPSAELLESEARALRNLAEVHARLITEVADLNGVDLDEDSDRFQSVMIAKVTVG